MLRTRKLLFGTTMFAGLLASASVVAQTTTPPQAPTTTTGAAQTPSQQAQSNGAPVVVVTGSRIKRATTFNSPTPITVITAEQATLAGEVNISNVLQLSVVANNGQQINNEYSEFLANGGPGVNTLSLRGLGSTRTLVLLNGERLGPAGVGGTVGPIDLNVLPQALIDHVEILKDGASSIYGSDAVAGVVNIITKTSENGEDIHVFGEAPEQTGGASWEVNGDVGRKFDRGYITAGFDYFHQDPLTYAQRSYLSCQRDLVVDAATRQPADIVDPATGKAKCFNEFLTPGVEDVGFGALFAGNGNGAGGIPGFTFVAPLSPPVTRAQNGAIPYNPPQFNQGNTAISAVTRYTFTFFGGFDITPHNQLYGSVLLNQRDSQQKLSDQFFTGVGPGNPFDPGFFLPIVVIPQETPGSQTVDYGRFVLGFKGDLPSFATLTNWTYDIYGQFSRSDGWYSQEYVRSDRVNATAGAGPGTNGCDTVNGFAPFTGQGNTMAVQEPGVACVPVNYFAAVQNGAFTPAEAAFLYTNERGHTTYNQEYLEGSITGNVINLPAGPLGAALGFHVRQENLDDTPGPDFLASNVYNFTVTGVTKGTERVYEGFGELQVPVLRNLPLVDSLDVNLSGRVSNYSSFGTDGTYKLNFNWAVTKWFSVRGNYGTAFRAPDLFELFLGNQVGFLPQFGLDPCILYGTSGVSQTVQKNCASQGIPPNFTGAQVGATIFNGGGAAFHLHPESARTETIGFVIKPTFGDMNLQFAVDWYSFVIKNQIAQFGAANILLQCYNSTSFPNNSFCNEFTRGGPQNGIVSVNNDFVNVASELDQGLDVSAAYTTRLPYDSKLSITSDLAWTFVQKIILVNGQVNNLTPLGAFGQPEFVGNVDFRVDKGPWTANWYLYMVGPVSDYPFAPPLVVSYRGTGQSVLNADESAGFYTTSNISLLRRFDKFTVEVGVKNVFNQTPPLYSNTGFEARFGTTALASQYDIIGRAYFVNLDARF